MCLFYVRTLIVCCFNTSYCDFLTFSADLIFNCEFFCNTILIGVVFLVYYDPLVYNFCKNAEYFGSDKMI